MKVFRRFNIDMLAEELLIHRGATLYELRDFLNQESYNHSEGMGYIYQESTWLSTVEGAVLRFVPPKGGRLKACEGGCDSSNLRHIIAGQAICRTCGLIWSIYDRNIHDQEQPNVPRP